MVIDRVASVTRSSPTAQKTSRIATSIFLKLGTACALANKHDAMFTARSSSYLLLLERLAIEPWRARDEEVSTACRVRNTEVFSPHFARARRRVCHFIHDDFRALSVARDHQKRNGGAFSSVLRTQEDASYDILAKEAQRIPRKITHGNPLAEFNASIYSTTIDRAQRAPNDMRLLVSSPRDASNASPSSAIDTYTAVEASIEHWKNRPRVLLYVLIKRPPPPPLSERPTNAPGTEAPRGTSPSSGSSPRQAWC